MEHEMEMVNGSPEELRPWVLSKIIAQAQLMKMTGLELKQYIEDNLFLGRFTSDAAKFDGIKAEVHKIDTDSIDVKDVFETLKKSDLSQEEIDVYLEVLAEKLMMLGKQDKAELLSQEISNPEIQESIKFQIDKMRQQD